MILGDTEQALTFASSVAKMRALLVESRFSVTLLMLLTNFCEKCKFVI